MEAIQMIGISPKEFIEQIKESLIPEIKEQLTAELKKEPDEFLTRTEVCEMLKIDLSTLHRWRKDGVLTAFGVGNRVYFRRSEIDDLMERNRI